MRGDWSDESNDTAVEAIAEQLLARGSLTGGEVAEILAANPPQEGKP